MSTRYSVRDTLRPSSRTLSAPSPHVHVRCACRRRRHTSFIDYKSVLQPLLPIRISLEHLDHDPRYEVATYKARVGSRNVYCQYTSSQQMFISHYRIAPQLHRIAPQPAHEKTEGVGPFKPWTSNPKPQTQNPEPLTLNPNPKPLTLNPIPYTLTLNPKP